MFRALQSEIQRNMERIFIRAGSDVSMTNEAMFVYFLNTKKDMSIVHVTRRAPPKAKELIDGQELDKEARQ